MNLRKRKRETGSDGKERLCDRLSRLCGIPADAVGIASGFMAEMRGRGEVQIRGCERILVYLPERITLLTRDGEWTVAGRGLTCTAYDCGSLGIEGQIDGVYAEAALPHLAERLRESEGDAE